METKTIEVQVGKETYELTSGIVGFIKGMKVALADGWQPGEDFPVILMEAVVNLIPAVQGADMVDDEAKENRGAFIRSLALMAGDLYDVLVTPDLPPLVGGPAE